jgi:hypothetical protein
VLGLIFDLRAVAVDNRSLPPALSALLGQEAGDYAGAHFAAYQAMWATLGEPTTKRRDEDLALKYTCKRALTSDNASDTLLHLALEVEDRYGVTITTREV